MGRPSHVPGGDGAAGRLVRASAPSSRPSWYIDAASGLAVSDAMAGAAATAPGRFFGTRGKRPLLLEVFGFVQFQPSARRWQDQWGNSVRSVSGTSPTPQRTERHEGTDTWTSGVGQAEVGTAHGRLRPAGRAGTRRRGPARAPQDERESGTPIALRCAQSAAWVRSVTPICRKMLVR